MGLMVVGPRSKFDINVEKYGLQKTYCNTHKYRMRKHYEPTFFGSKQVQNMELMFAATRKNGGKKK